MGPIALFDKSFLQSLNIDESVWFDHFYITNICPIFFAETLADLSKQGEKGRSALENVAILAKKFPEKGSAPSAHHVELCISNLLGYPVSMRGQILVNGAIPVNKSGKRVMVIDPSPEADAFQRWQKGEFDEIEHRYARIWRSSIQKLDLKQANNQLKEIGINGAKCKTLEGAKALAEDFVQHPKTNEDLLLIALSYLVIPPQDASRIFKYRSSLGFPPLFDDAPYAAYVLMVELFFRIALQAYLISFERKSNRIDLLYLHYLPFCMIFISRDRLHQKCAPLFLRDNQIFIWGDDLKRELKEINKFYLQMPEDERKKGILTFAAHPPKNEELLTYKLWDRFLPGWKGDVQKKENLLADNPQKHLSIDEIVNIKDAEDTDIGYVGFNPSNPDGLIIRRKVSRKKGSWYQAPA